MRYIMILSRWDRDPIRTGESVGVIWKRSWRSPGCMTSSRFKGCFFASTRCALIVARALIVNALLFICRAESNNQSLSGRVYLIIIHGFCFHSNICICFAVKCLITLQWQRREPLTQRSSINPNKGSALLVTKIDFFYSFARKHKCEMCSYSCRCSANPLFPLFNLLIF